MQTKIVQQLPIRDELMLQQIDSGIKVVDCRIRYYAALLLMLSLLHFILCSYCCIAFDAHIAALLSLLILLYCIRSSYCCIAFVAHSYCRIAFVANIVLVVVIALVFVTTIHAHNTSYPSYARIQVGHIVSFSCSGSVIYKRVVQIRRYKDFKSMLQVEGVQSCLPQLKDGDYEGGVRIYHSFRGYKALAEVYGVLAFRLADVTVTPVDALNRRQQKALTKILTGSC